MGTTRDYSGVPSLQIQTCIILQLPAYKFAFRQIKISMIEKLLRVF